MSKKILVTGANGFVGQHLAKELANHGYNVAGIGGNNIPPPNLTFFDEYLSLDLLDTTTVNKISFKDVDSVIHLSGLAAIGPSYDQPMNYITTNIGLELNLFETAIKQKMFPGFLIISSGSLYSSLEKLPLDESSHVIPSSPYAVSKLGQENLAQYYLSRGFECIIARPFNHIGPGQGPGFIVTDLIEQIKLVKEKHKSIISVGDLSTKRDYTDVRDIVRAYRLLIERGRPGEIYNVCSGKSISGEEILSRLIKLSGVKAKIVIDKNKYRPSDIKDIYGSYDKLARDTGWSPAIDIDITLRDALTNYLDK